MASIFDKYRLPVLLMMFMAISFQGVGQELTDKWKLQFSLGVNNPLDAIENDGYYSRNINFPTVNFGIQHMFNYRLGAKLDVGYNRSRSADGSKSFKLNYTRINAQAVYDFTNWLNFLPEPMSINIHAGPGITFTRPLENDKENKYTYLNFIGGLELHYDISRTVSVFGDLGYAMGLSGENKYDVKVDGFSFNGNLIYASIGVSVALSGCRTCN